jgi:predicted HTH domain antitoxin
VLTHDSASINRLLCGSEISKRVIRLEKRFNYGGIAPSGVADRYGVSAKQIKQHLLEQAAIEGFRSGELSRGHVAQMLHLEWEDTEKFLAKHQCDRHYELDDLEQDRKNIGTLFGPT